MMKGLFLISAAAAVLVAATGCHKDKDNTARDAAVLLALSANSTTSPATTELAAMEAAASILERVARGGGAFSGEGFGGTPSSGGRSGIRAITTTVGSCTNSSSSTSIALSCTGATMNGSANCPLGGTITMTNVVSDLSLNMNMATMAGSGTRHITGGTITYSACKVQYLDTVLNQSVVAEVNGTLSGITSDYASVGTFSITSSGSSGATGSGTLTITQGDSATFGGMRVNGVPIADGAHTVSASLNATREATVSTTTTATGSTITSSSTTTYGPNSTVSVDGVPKYDLSNKTFSESRTMTCTVSGATVTCQ